MPINGPMTSRLPKNYLFSRGVESVFQGHSCHFLAGEKDILVVYWYYRDRDLTTWGLKELGPFNPELWSIFIHLFNPGLRRVKLYCFHPYYVNSWIAKNLKEQPALIFQYIMCGSLAINIMTHVCLNSMYILGEFGILLYGNV